MKLALISFALLLGACNTVENDPGTPVNRNAVQNLVSYTQSLIGIPYKFGGNSPDTGFDCSGFVGHVFSHVLDIKLPRNSDEMSHWGKTVDTSSLRAGDLVFFNTLQRRFSHVGIYLGDNLFIHAPSSSGRVRTENMRHVYWKSRYEGARRITF